MKITSIELHPEGSSTVVELSFRDPGATNKFNVIGITGLDADEIVPRSYMGAVSQTFYNMMLNRREIAIKVKLNPDWSASESYSDLRDELMRMIASSRTGLVEIQFKNDDDITAVLFGLIIKFETPHFERDQQVTLILRCDYPILQAPSRVDVDVEGLSPALFVVDDALSTAPHGLVMELLVVATGLTELEISHPDGDWTFEMNHAIANGASIFFSSEFDNKYLYYNAGASDIHLASSITASSVWPLIFPGENSFEFSLPTKLQIVSISHYPTYWAV